MLKSALRDDILRRFQEGFKGYTVDMFKLAHRVTLRDLRNLLVSYGVPVDTPRRGLSCADALQACLEKLPQPQASIQYSQQPQQSSQPSYTQP